MHVANALKTRKNLSTLSDGFEKFIENAKRGGKFLVSCSPGGDILHCEEIGPDRFLLTLAEFIEMARNANYAPSKSDK